MEREGGGCRAKVGEIKETGEGRGLKGRQKRKADPGMLRWIQESRKF